MAINRLIDGVWIDVDFTGTRLVNGVWIEGQGGAAPPAEEPVAEIIIDNYYHKLLASEDF